MHGKSAPHAISNVLCPKLPSHTNPQAESNAPRKVREHQLVGRSALALRRPLCEDAYINVHARGERQLQTWTSIAGHPKRICIYTLSSFVVSNTAYNAARSRIRLSGHDVQIEVFKRPRTGLLKFILRPCGFALGGAERHDEGRSPARGVHYKASRRGVSKWGSRLEGPSRHKSKKAEREGREDDNRL